MGKDFHFTSSSSSSSHESFTSSSSTSSSAHCFLISSTFAAGAAGWNSSESGCGGDLFSQGQKFVLSGRIN
jgi:hypothetical protein